MIRKLIYTVSITAIILSVAACSEDKEEAKGACWAYTSPITQPEPNTWRCLQQSTQKTCKDIFDSTGGLYTRYNWKKGE